MHWIDWAIVGGFLIFLTLSALYTKKYMKGVSSFLSADRCAGRYLLAVACGMGSMGAISIVSVFEVHYKAGFVPKWWEAITLPVGLIIAVTGWVAYRFRQTRALTMAQFLEMRYSRHFRVFAGLVAFISGIINFGIFPAVGARFFIYFCGLPHSIPVLGIAIPTFALLMIILLSISLFFTFCSGQIAVIVTDFLQGTFFNIVSIILLFYLLSQFSWPQITQALLNAPADQSKVNPFQTSGEEYFNLWFYVITAFGMFYGFMSWQGGSGYYSSAKSPHEAKMGNVIYQWKNYVLLLLLVMIPICAYTVMHHPDFLAQTTEVNHLLDGISTDTGDAIRTQMQVPVILRTMIPKGLMGAMCAVMLAAFISTHDTYLHSWGSIFIQDVIMPFRKKPFEPKQHINVLRWSIFGVAVFIFIFSLVFKPNKYILMFFALTGTIFLGGSGAAIVGGLYWKRGSTLGAYCAMITGAVLGVGGIVINKINPDFFLNGQEMFFVAMISAMVIYVVVSLCGKTNFNLDKMLHRGKYAIAEDQVIAEDIGEAALLPAQTKGFLARSWEKLITKEFTRKDKILYAVTLSWLGGWVLIFIVGSIYNKIKDVSNKSWLEFWHVWVWVLAIFAVVATTWLAYGGFRDLKEMFKILDSRTVDSHDDGWVTEDDEPKK